MKCAVRILLAVMALTLSTQVSYAHRPNESYIYFNVTDDTLSGRFEATLTDLDAAMDIDRDNDGKVTRDEALAAANEIFEFLRNATAIQANEQTVVPEFAGMEFLDTPQGTYAQVGFVLPLAGPTPATIDVTYKTPFASALPGHSAFALIESNTRTGVADNEGYISLSFAPGAETQMLSLTGEPAAKIFEDFGIFGAKHIWFGLDHLLFLMAILLPAVLTRNSDNWQPASTFGPGFVRSLKLIALFTLAHIAAQTFAAFTSLPASPIVTVTAITVSLIAVALMNLLPGYLHLAGWVAVFFGLFHGFAIADALAPLGTTPSAMLLGLGAFNGGVFIGQVALVLGILPILFLFRRWSIYPVLAVKLGTVGIILLTAVWAFERGTGLVYQLKQTIAG